MVVFDACACLYERGFCKCESDGLSAFVRPTTVVVIIGGRKNAVFSDLSVRPLAKYLTIIGRG